MSDLVDDIRLDFVRLGAGAENRKQVLEILAEISAANLSYQAADIFLRLAEKENAAGSGIGDAVAVPHLKLPRLFRPFKALVTLRAPVDFKAPDHRRVDLVCLVVSPEDDGPLHLRRLSRVSRVLKTASIAGKIRTCQDEDMVKALMQTPEEWTLAA